MDIFSSLPFTCKCPETKPVICSELGGKRGSGRGFPSLTLQEAHGGLAQGRRPQEGSCSRTRWRVWGPPCPPRQPRAAQQKFLLPTPHSLRPPATIPSPGSPGPTASSTQEGPGLCWIPDIPSGRSLRRTNSISRCSPFARASPEPARGSFTATYMQTE